MADLDRYLRYLQRDDVTELLLQTGKVAALKLEGGKLHPLTKSPLGSGHIVALLEGVGWGALIPRQDTGGQVQAAKSNGIIYGCRIARRLDQLQVAVTPDPAAASENSQPKPRAKPAAPPQPAQVARPSAPARTPAPARRVAAPPAAAPTPSKPAAAAKPAPSPARASASDAAIADALAAVDSVRGQGSPAAPKGDAKIDFSTRPPRYTWASGTPETRLLALLREARASGCTDVHIVGGQPARLRRLTQLEACGDPLPPAEQMLLPLLERAGSSFSEQFHALGYADFAVDLPGSGRLRVNFAKGQSGLKGCFRFIVPAPPQLDQLGLPHELEKVAHHHQGLAVVSGPSGQGKTTTMAALVDLVNRSKPHHIITVEDPIEVVHPIRKAVISQRQVGLHTKSFHSALKGALREDPDVIVIGELRDRETVEMALQAAETGHLVIASMSTPSGAKTIDRLIDMFPPDDQAQVRSTLAGALKVVISQRLIPTVGGDALVAAAELITGNIPLWSLIRENKLFQLPSLLQRGRNYGMISAEDSLNDLLERGLIDEAMAKRYADDPRRIGPNRNAVSGGPGSGPETEKPAPKEEIGKSALGAMRNMFGRGRKDGE